MFRSVRLFLVISVILLAASVSFPASIAAVSAPSMDADNSTPIFISYKGISIGMLTEQVRASLGSPKSSADASDTFAPSDHEFISVYYERGKVSAFTITFTGDIGSAPAAKTVLGEEADVKPDGGLFKMVRYPKAGFWVSYCKIVGDEPIVIIAVNKI